MTPQEAFPKLLETALAEATESTHRTMNEHGLQGLAGWALNEQRARLLFGDPAQRYAIMAAQAVGLYDAESRRWRWAWHEPGFPPHFVQAALHAREWGRLNSIPVLTEGESIISDDEAWRLCAFTARLVGWPGIYRGVGGPSVIFLAFAPTLNPDGGPEPVLPVTADQNPSSAS